LQAFLQRFLRAAHIATTFEYHYLESLARYILELSLLDYSMLVYRSSTVAAASILLARVLLAHAHRESENTRPHVVWTRTLEHYAFHTAKELEGCVYQLHRMLITLSSKQKKAPFVCSKYKQQKWLSVASLPFMTTLPSEMFDRFCTFPVPAESLPQVAQ
jgi:cyclin-A